MSHVDLSIDQLAALAAAGLSRPSPEILDALATLSAAELDDAGLVTLLEICNAAYRAGYPMISDAVYDSVFVAALRQRQPDHPFLHNVEPEPVLEGKTVPLPQKMLSTDKAYSFDEIRKWVERLLKAAEEIGFDPADLTIRVTPKLDGYAAYDDGEHFYTRGDGVRGQDISRAFARGLTVEKLAGRGLGPGEIVTRKSYFEQYLSEQFENSRNIQAAIIAEKNVEPAIQQAINDGACVFYPFSVLTHWSGHYQYFLEHFDEIREQIWTAEDFEVDGIIIEAVPDAIKSHMGANRKFHRWQIAYKSNVETANVRVLGVTPQTSRTGRITPVAELEPTRLSGATLSRVTVHHYAMVKERGVGKGAVIQLVRSGLVIPKIEAVLQSVEPDIPDVCPSCGAHLVWDGDHLVCTNTTDCPAQSENTLFHFFQTLGNIDGFGPKVIEKLHAQGLSKIHEIYGLDVERLQQMGFGEKTASNLVRQLAQSRALPVEDWRFLAAFGVPRLGVGNCERILQHCRLEDVFALTVDSLTHIDGFAQLSAEVIIEALSHIKAEFDLVFALGFALERTELASDQIAGTSPIAGLTVVFTGTMVQGSRPDMEKQARKLGAKVAKSVTAQTDFLITGDKVGARKITDAQEKGVRILSEVEYLDLLRSG